MRDLRTIILGKNWIYDDHSSIGLKIQGNSIINSQKNIKPLYNSGQVLNTFNSERYSYFLDGLKNQ